MDQMGKLPSEFLPKNMGRLIEGCEAIEINKDIKEVYKNGIDNNLKPKLLRNAKKRNITAALNPIKTEIPNPIFSLLKLYNIGTKTTTSNQQFKWVPTNHRTFRLKDPKTNL
jgi:hypothetical protein